MQIAPLPPRVEASYCARLLRRWFVEYNPLYLVSACLVLGGMIVLSRGLAHHDRSLYGELGVAAIAEAYAAALIGGAALLVRIGQRRPAVMLAFLTVLYQFDLTLHTETCAYLGAAVGLGAAAAWLALFVVKLRALAWAMRLRVSRRATLLACGAALGLAALPWVRVAAGPRGATALAALWLTALATFAPARLETAVASREELDPWGRIVLRRSACAAGAVSALLVLLHVLFWASEGAVDARAALAVLPVLAIRASKSEARVWAIAIGTLVAAAGIAPPAFALAALVVAVALVARALGGGFVARPRLLIGAVLATYLAAWTLGWSGGRWPDHVVALDVAMLAVVSLGVWKWRVRVALAPACASVLHAVIVARVIPAPETLVGWGALAIVCGFALLGASLGASYALREVTPARPPE